MITLRIIMRLLSDHLADYHAITMLCDYHALRTLCGVASNHYAITMRLLCDWEQVRAAESAELAAPSEAPEAPAVPRAR